MVLEKETDWMNKNERHELYIRSVYPGWWRILDRYIPKILEADPDVYLYIKEKYGYLRIEMASSKIDLQQMIDWENAAEVESSTVCEWCGQPGRIRTDLMWYQTLCDRCADVRGDNGLKRIIIEAEELRWLEEAEE